MRQLAERLVLEVTANPFGTTRADWRRAVPSAKWTDFQGPTGYPTDKPSAYRWPTGRWCSIADDENGNIRRQAVFYADRTDEPLDCRLEQITYVIEPADVSAKSAELYGELVASFTRRLGFGSPQGPQSDIVRAEGNLRGYVLDFPREAFINWDGGSYGVNVFMVLGLRVGFVARHNAYAYSSDLTPRAALLVPVDEMLKEALLDKLYGRFPNVAELLLDSRNYLDASILVPALKTLLLALDRAADPNDRAWLALAAEELLMRLDLPGDELLPPAGRPELADLTPFNLEFRYDGHGGSWEYAGGLSDAVVSRYPQTDWGQLAFLRWIGHSEVVECADTYDEAVKQGSEWLKRFPTSKYRLRVIQAIAEAYETWWSLSRAPAYDEFAFYSREAAAPGAPRARTEAIDWYERLLKELPGGVPTRGIVQTLIHLKLDVDTGQRAFHCAIP